jgi:hypothetical protein
LKAVLPENAQEEAQGRREEIAAKPRQIEVLNAQGQTGPWGDPVDI